MSQPTISIIGAGISGLVLGRCLLTHGIRATVYEKAALSQKRHGYGITLHPSAYKPLLRFLNLDDNSFRRTLAVDGATGGHDNLSSRLTEVRESGSFRANRQRLEQLLLEGLNVQWDHDLDAVKPSGGGDGVSLDFANGQHEVTDLVVAGDGVHSQVRKSISPSTGFTVLPYAVYNGKRRLTTDDFDKKLAAHVDDANVIEHRAGQTLLRICIDDRTDERVSISYTFSRPACREDPLFKPDRPNSGAKSIPEALYDEINGLGELPAPFRDAFNAEAVREDRLLNWLMRSVSVSEGELRDAANKGIVLMGDAAHATPILGGWGANEAIVDGIELAELIASKGLDGLEGYYDDKYDGWQRSVADSEVRIAEMHGKQKSSL